METWYLKNGKPNRTFPEFWDRHPPSQPCANLNIDLSMILFLNNLIISCGVQIIQQGFRAPAGANTNYTWYISVEFKIFFISTDINGKFLLLIQATGQVIFYVFDKKQPFFLLAKKKTWQNSLKRSCFSRSCLLRSGSVTTKSVSSGHLKPTSIHFKFLSLNIV